MGAVLIVLLESVRVICRYFRMETRMICRICNNPDKNRTFLIKEMMFGSEEAFTYLECSNCGCLQILNPPSEIKEAYPSNYYSFQKAGSRAGGPQNLIKHALSKKKDHYALFKKGILARLIHAAGDTHALFDLMGNAQVTTSSKVLDVGCGAGSLLGNLQDHGFVNLAGIDPYAQDYSGPGIRIQRKTIEELGDNLKFDVIVFNHSFEHMPDQPATLRKALALLCGNGVCLIRQPIKTEYIWNRYGTNWAQIDAPRHYTIHTLKSFKLLLKRTDFVIEDIIFDSWIFPFVASEQNAQGIPQNAQESYYVDSKRSIFNAKQIKKFKQLSKQLNIAKQGDQAVFCLRKKDRAS
jgi:2-polyprenyl-3-methyl-5-hydroxy-6-metoxy-1,4-benzoquinol methylase